MHIPKAVLPIHTYKINTVFNIISSRPAGYRALGEKKRKKITKNVIHITLIHITLIHITPYPHNISSTQHFIHTSVKMKSNASLRNTLQIRRRRTRHIARLITQRNPTIIIRTCPCRKGRLVCIRSTIAVYNFFLTDLSINYVDQDGKPRRHPFKYIYVEKTKYTRLRLLSLLNNRHNFPHFPPPHNAQE